MSNVFTLDSMREEIEKEFAPCQVDLGDGKVVTLRNLLRLGKTVREQVYALLDDLNADKEDESASSGLVETEKAGEIALKIFPLVADSEKLGRQLVDAIEDDLALTLRVFSNWMNGAQVGEADSLDS